MQPLPHAYVKSKFISSIKIFMSPPIIFRPSVFYSIANHSQKVRLGRLWGFAAAALVAGLGCWPAAAADPAPAGGWTETFDSGSWVERWVPYGRLSDGTWAQGAEGHWPNPPGHHLARIEWWQIENGAIRGTNFPDEQHPAGLSRRGGLSPQFQQTGIRLRCRLKVSESSTVQVKIGGQSPGILPNESTDHHTAVVDVKAGGIRFWNGNRFLVSEEPPANEGEKPKRKFKNNVLEKKSDLPLTPHEWHDLVYDLKGRNVRVAVDGTEVLSYQLPHIHPLQGMGFEVNGDKKSIGMAWVKEVAVEPLP